NFTMAAQVARGRDRHARIGSAPGRAFRTDTKRSEAPGPGSGCGARSRGRGSAAARKASFGLDGGPLADQLAKQIEGKTVVRGGQSRAVHAREGRKRNRSAGARERPGDGPRTGA